MPALKGNRAFTAHINGQDRRFLWTTREERDEVVRELRAAGLRPVRIAKLIGVSKWHIYYNTKPAMPKTSYAHAKLKARLRAETYDLIYRYSIRHGLKLCDALDILVTRGAEAINFKPDELKSDRSA